MLKLIYHTGVFGPIDLEYDRPVIRVGRSEDNDLVLRHASVAPYHCRLVFRDETVLCLPPGEAIFTETEELAAGAPGLGVGDELSIGQLRFTLAHSDRTVAVPPLRRHERGAEDGSAAGAGEAAAPNRYFCPHCRLFFRASELKRVGLVGRAKRCLCPKCSGVLDMEAPSPPPRRKKIWGFTVRKPTASTPRAVDK